MKGPWKKLLALRSTKNDFETLQLGAFATAASHTWLNKDCNFNRGIRAARRSLALGDHRRSVRPSQVVIATRITIHQWALISLLVSE